MRHGSSNRRNRNRNNNGGNRNRSGNQGKSRVYDSNGPDVRIRGTAHQIAEKYEILAKDCQSSGDYMMSENYLQHAEHYLRLIASMTPPARENKQQSQKEQSLKNNSSKDDSDLSLPASIIGAKDEMKSQEKIAETA